MKSCAFTGHRPKSYPWKYDESAKDCKLLKKTLSKQIAALMDRGVTDWLSGMALGVDLWSAWIVLELREKNSALKLHCILPCEGQESKWEPLMQEQYRFILEQANEVIYIRKEYHRNCMLERNRYLVDHSRALPLMKPQMTHFVSSYINVIKMTPKRTNPIPWRNANGNGALLNISFHHKKEPGVFPRLSFVF